MAEDSKPKCFGNHADRDPGCKKCPVEHQCEYGLVDAYYKAEDTKHEQDVKGK